MTADRRFRRMLGAARQTSVVGVIGTVVGGSDTGSVIGAKLVPATGAEFFGFFSRSRRSPSAAASSFSGGDRRFGAVFLLDPQKEVLIHRMHGSGCCIAVYCKVKKLSNLVE